MRTVIALACSVLIACGSDDESPRPEALGCTFDTPDLATLAFDAIDVLPAETDPAIPSSDVANLVFYPRQAELRDELFLYLPGTHTLPTDSELIPKAAVLLGYRTISLVYDNSVSVAERCQGEDPDCSYRAREENQTGRDVSTVIEMDEVGSIDHRVLRLLQFLARNHPSQGWDHYLDGEEIRWSRIAVAGHSQGGGQAAWISKERELARAVFFSNPGDGYGYERGEAHNAPWTLEPRATPSERMYSLHHEEEIAATRAEEILVATGMIAPGGVVRVSDASPPYGCSHALSLGDPAGGVEGVAHGMVALDDAIVRKADGSPLHHQAYLYLLSAH